LCVAEHKIVLPVQCQNYAGEKQEVLKQMFDYTLLTKVQKSPKNIKDGIIRITKFEV